MQEKPFHMHLKHSTGTGAFGINYFSKNLNLYFVIQKNDEHTNKTNTGGKKSDIVITVLSQNF